MSEARAGFPCFGGECTVRVLGGAAEVAVAASRVRLLGWHAQFTRFDPASALSRFNADPAATVAVGPVMARFADAVVTAARRTGGLVDGTLLRALEDAGYAGALDEPLLIRQALALAPPRRPAAPSHASRWREIVVGANTVTRPPGVGLDSGGLAKGLFADLLGADLGGHRSFAVDCSGDLLLGGEIVRDVHVDDPFGRGGPLHTFRLAAGGVATSGIARRSWRDADGRPAHHLLDPSTGRPAYTGIVQATALAPTALEAEIRAKAALLSGPGAADAWLPDGGVIVFDDGRHRVLEPTTERIDDGTPRPAAAA